MTDDTTTKGDDSMTTKTCSARGCDKPCKARGLCWGHYTAWLRSGVSDGRPARLCSIEGCERVHYARGWCYRHWSNWKYRGDPLAAPIARRSAQEIQQGREERERRWEAEREARQDNLERALALKDLRVEAGLKQKAVADEAGLDFCYLSRVENGKSGASAEQLGRIEAAMERLREGAMA